MKKIISLFLSATLSLVLVACGNTNTERQKETSSNTDRTTSESIESASESLPDETDILENSTGQRILVAYFSWADNAEKGEVDAITSASVTIPGNVAQLAAWVAGETDGDLFSIQVTDPYPSDWDECLNRANQEKADAARPELVQNVENVEEYDVVFLGYPNWWYSCPMAILSFLESHDFSGKQIYLFCSHGTGGLAGSVQDITAALPNSNISENVFDVNEDDIADSRENINEWLKSIGY